MKIKKILLSIFAVILCVPAIFFAGCKDKNSINMPTYFENKVSYTTMADGSKTIDVALKDFTHDAHNNMAQYTSITFTGKSNWLYKMYVEKIVFEVYSNKTEEIEIGIKITNVKNGNDSTTGTSTTYVGTFPAYLKKGKAVKVSIPINTYFLSSSSSTTIKLTVDSNYYSILDTNNQSKNTGLKLDILNFGVIGTHDLNKIKY